MAPKPAAPQDDDVIQTATVLPSFGALISTLSDAIERLTTAMLSTNKRRASTDSPTAVRHSKVPAPCRTTTRPGRAP
ncbi:hypothetical protein ACVC7V_11000 [Hydrogenophaga sp. A37]|uniref:hypothetical protein n=1 Tax=Hydrogenophaga sp. A37 TaxID=1945864 RepID=UPI0009852722|nr:hypothetical protein [Hydrogenophaga sp. A37]OOG80927.1 hypothetical protein B0E41_19565 [Hydrogenophaga sp. A37]